ncbi:hypothetical protein AVB70_21090 [Salmonella enterica subsp. enterica serovar Agama]|nr:hypothetical protein [Salmonella enterica subsp. enterica serovar Durham]EBZ0839870.1 hypothetical protein [Salmonella enterica subsp. enterica serovar Agama]ECA0045110.1 hypothetical protein [Salmonella enterica subsp. enterica serovar Agona]ECB1778527.1 hypothetical protein [Salmonella enterica subsp. enterica serovar Kibi]ECG7292766.1 hypothetical protein [Salmonella enterica subsp. enterica serovar Bahati]ECL5754272.1 hypothetical protein [Salmonella enterica]
MAKRKYSNRKARIEKKFSTSAKELLLRLVPKNFKPDDFSFECGGFCGRYGYVYYREWVVWGAPDYWTGEQDYSDAFFVLHDFLISHTTDWDGIGRAHDAVNWAPGVEVDESPFYSPWRIGDVTRAQIISHCRKLAAAGVTWN